MQDLDLIDMHLATDIFEMVTNEFLKCSYMIFMHGL